MKLAKLSWKEKAVQRRIQVKQLHKRLKETKQSRDKWKDKYFELKAELDTLSLEKAALKKK